MKETLGKPNLNLYEMSTMNEKATLDGGDVLNTGGICIFTAVNVN